MERIENNREFFLEGSPVGVIRGAIAAKPGRWSYAPYRSFGHFSMVTRLHAGESVECFVEAENERIRFTVIGVPEYGVIEVASIES